MEFKGHADQSFGHITYSQTGEDIIICNIFEKILKIDKPSYLDLGAQKPSYLDLGAHHPFNISNTALLYQRGYRGVNIEANPNLIDDFIKHRPEDRNVCVGIVADESIKKATMHMFDSRSGRNSLIAGYMESDPYGPLPANETLEVDTRTINDIVQIYCDGKFPEFLSVDIEGMDYDILQSADFEKYGYPSVICVEALQYREPQKLISMMAKRGYIPLIRLSINLLFVRMNSFHLFVS